MTQMTAERVGTDHLLRLRSQTIEPIAQVDRAAGQENLRASRRNLSLARQHSNQIERFFSRLPKICGPRRGSTVPCRNAAA